MLRIYSLIKFLGFDPVLFLNNIRGLRIYLKDLRLLKKQQGKDTTFYFGKKYPVLNNRFSNAGTIKGHYFHQDLYVGKKIFNASPQKHVDVGSRIDGFVSHLAVFREIEVFDIRKLTSNVKEIIYKQKDLMNLDDSMINYCDSISSLHAIEHFGLGRYGDPIDYFGHLKAIRNITKILKTNGIFYFSVPIGKQRIEFNAHRVFSIKYLLEIFEENYTLISFSYVNDKGDLFEDIQLTDSNIRNNLGCVWGCGIFELKKVKDVEGLSYRKIP